MNEKPTHSIHTHCQVAQKANPTVGSTKTQIQWCGDYFQNITIVLPSGKEEHRYR